MDFEYEERLIKEVKKYECLYNLNHSDYKKVDRKEAVWREIAQALKSTPDLTKRKWRNIRDYFYQIKRAENLPTRSGAAKRKKWKHLESCSFLNTVPKTRPTLGFIPSESEETMPSPLTPSESEAVFTFHSTTSTPAEQEKNDEFREFLQCDTDPIKTPCQTTQAVVSNNNSMTPFFSSLAADIADANLSQMDIIDIKMEISSIVYEKILHKLTSCI